MPDFQVAQLNIALLKAPLDSPDLRGFVGNLDRINTLADRSPGFCWRLQADIGTRHAHLGQSGSDRILPGDESRPACGTALLTVVIGKHHAFSCDPVDIRGTVTDQAKGVSANVALANINASNQMVASGEIRAIEQLSRLAKAEDITEMRLPVSNAFHCRLTSPAAEKLARQVV